MTVILVYSLIGVLSLGLPVTSITLTSPVTLFNNIPVFPSPP